MSTYRRQVLFKLVNLS